MQGLSHDARNGIVPRLARMALILMAATVFSPANAGPILGEPVLGGRFLVASADQNVTVEFLGSHAGYTNYLYTQLMPDFRFFTDR
jgi:hypothetical protein